MNFRAIFLVVGVLAASVFPADSPDRTAQIKHLLDISGALKIGPQIAELISNQLIDAIKQSKADLPDSAADSIRSGMVALVNDGMKEKDALVDRMCQVYSKHFTDDEVKQLIAFYESPIGKKAIQLMPDLIQESVTTGQTWAESVGPKYVEKLRLRLLKKGIKLPKI